MARIVFTTIANLFAALACMVFHPRIITALVYLCFMTGFPVFVTSQSAPCALYLIPVIAAYAGAACGET